MLFRRWRELILFICNHIFCGTRFFNLKRLLLNSCSGIKIGKGTRIVSLKASNCSDVTIGEDCWIGSQLSIYGDGKVVIGDRCDFAPEVAIVTGTHEIGDANRRAGKGKLMTTMVGDGCWIGARAILMGDIIIGNACIVGAGSLVSKSVSENQLVAGVPAKILRELQE